MLGMSIAHRLAQRGEAVELFEAAPNFGGLASAWQLGDIIWDRHYHVTLLSDSAIRELLTELNLEADIDWVQTKTGFYTEGKLFSMSNSVEFLRFPPLNILDKFRLAATIFYASRIKDWKRLEQITVSDWLNRWSGRSTFEKMWLPLLRAKLGENYRTTSAAFIWATIARMYAARRTGLKKEMFGYVPGGYARVLERFGSLLSDEGITLNTCARVEKISRDSTGRLVVSNGNGNFGEFENVVVTAPAPVAAALCANLTAEEKAGLEAVQYQGIVCASLLLKKPLAQFYVTNITDAALPFTAVIEMSAMVDRKHFGGNALIYLPKYVDPGDPIFLETDESIKARFIAALEKMYPEFQSSDVLEFKISRVRHVFPLPTLNYSQRLPPITTSVPGLHIINSSHIVNGTLNVNETVQLANRFASSVRGTGDSKGGVA
jgi:protoporphyrinogen oxidase